MMSLTPSPHAAVPLEVLQQWLKMHKNVIGLLQVLQTTPDPKTNEEHFRSLFRLLYEKNLVCPFDPFAYRPASSPAPFLVRSRGMAAQPWCPARESIAHIRGEAPHVRREHHCRILPRPRRYARATQGWPCATHEHGRPVHEPRRGREPGAPCVWPLPAACLADASRADATGADGAVQLAAAGEEARRSAPFGE